MMINKLFFVVFILVFSGCINQQQNSLDSSKTGVVVSILPLKHFVERIGGDKVDVTVMVPPGASPHTYEPKPSQMKAVGDAMIYMKVGSGVEFENAWMDRILSANEKMMVVDCSKGITLIGMGEHHHDEDEEHERDGVDDKIHGGLDPHIWTSVNNAKIMVDNIYAGLVQIDPKNQQYYMENKNTYLKELDELDSQLGDSFNGLESKKFMVFHPAWGYLAKDYGLTQVPVEQEGKEPSAKELGKIIEEANKEGIQVVFVSPQFNRDTADSIAKEIGGAVLMIDPLAENYISNLRMVASNISKSLA